MSASVQNYASSPYQFRLTHDISFESLSAISSSGSPDCDLCTELQPEFLANHNNADLECNQQVRMYPKLHQPTHIDNYTLSSNPTLILDSISGRSIYDNDVQSKNVVDVVRTAKEAWYRKHKANSQNEDVKAKSKRESSLSPPEPYTRSVSEKRHHSRSICDPTDKKYTNVGIDILSGSTDVLASPKHKLFKIDVRGARERTRSEGHEYSSQDDEEDTKNTDDGLWIENYQKNMSPGIKKSRTVRKQRKLPEIPNSASPKSSSPFPMNMSRSIAEELLEVDPALKEVENLHLNDREVPQAYVLNNVEWDLYEDYSDCFDIDTNEESQRTHLNDGTHIEDEDKDSCEDEDYESLDVNEANLCNGEQKSSDTSSCMKLASRRNIMSSSTSSSASVNSDLDESEATHRGCHKFIPRHADEMFIEIGDPLYVEEESDDLWCEGTNLRTGQRGIFPSVYATDLSFLEENDGQSLNKFRLRFLGSIEVSHHKGMAILTKAISKVISSRDTNKKLAPTVILEVDEHGLKMEEKKKGKKATDENSARMRLLRLLSREKGSMIGLDHLFSLKNISYCGVYPQDERYFAFISKHPTDLRYACHVFEADRSTKCVSEAVASAFRRFYQQYMAFVHPTEDIYLE